MDTYSIAFRVRRTTYEDAYIVIPVTDRIMKENADGASGIDFAAYEAEARRISQDSRVEWQVESTTIEGHPIQQAAPEDRKSMDAFYSDNK